jgi:hypothetical protein
MAVHQFTDASYPGGTDPGAEEPLREEADQWCLQLFDTIVARNSNRSDAGDLAFASARPDRQQWATGVHHMACFVGVHGSGKLAGALI